MDSRSGEIVSARSSFAVVRSSGRATAAIIASSNPALSICRTGLNSNRMVYLASFLCNLVEGAGESALSVHNVDDQSIQTMLKPGKLAKVTRGDIVVDIARIGVIRHIDGIK